MDGVCCCLLPLPNGAASRSGRHAASAGEGVALGRVWMAAAVGAVAAVAGRVRETAARG